MPRFRDDKWPISRYTKFPRRLREFQKLGDSVCWEWPGRLNRKGYGSVASKVSGLSTLAHKRAWQLLRGEVPEGMQLDHLCRNKRCCNPSHLEIVTATINSRRAMPYRVKRTHCKNGHEFTAANTSIAAADGSRVCLACKRETAARIPAERKRDATRRYRERKRAQSTTSAN